jgi:hypothetical protein
MAIDEVDAGWNWKTAIPAQVAIRAQQVSVAKSFIDV